MRYSNMRFWKKILPLLLVLLLASTASAYTLNWENPEKHSSAGHWTKDTLDIEVSVTDGAHVNHTWFWYNTSDGYNLISDSINDTPDQTSWTASLDTTNPESDAIELLVNATNQTNEKIWKESATTIIVRDNEPPNSLTLDSPENNTVISSSFDIEASWSDEISGVEKAMYDITQDSSLYSVGTLDATGVDLTGLSDGIYHINLNATDRANNSFSKDNVARIRVDNNPPEIVESSIYPEDESKTGEDMPEIGFNLTDFTEVKEDSVVAWLDGPDNTYKFSSSALDFNYIKSYNGGRTLSVDFQPDSPLSGGVRYDLIVRAEDGSSHRMSNRTSWFKTDFSSPTFEGYTTYGVSAERNGKEWFGDNVTVQIHCTSNSGSPMDSYSISGKLGQDREKTSSQEKANITFEADPDIEKSIELTLGCADEGGHSTNSSFTAHLDSREPQLDSVTPSNGDYIQNSSSQDIVVRITDIGAGLSDSTVSKNLDPEFNDSIVEGYSINLGNIKDRATISWNETTLPGKKYKVSLDSSGKYKVSDLVGHTLEIDSWSFNTTRSAIVEENNTEETSESSREVIFSSVPSDIQIVPGRSKTIDVTLENQANDSRNVDLSADTDNPYLNSSFVVPSLILINQESRDFELNLSSSSRLSGSSEVDMEIEFSGGTSNASFNVEALSNARELSLSAPNFVDVDKGGQETFSIDASNNGKAVLEGLEPSLDRFLDRVSPENFKLEVNETRSVDMDVAVSEGTEIGKYSQEITVSNGEVSRSREVVFRVQPTSEELKENISSSIENLRQQFESRGNFSAKERVGSLISDAEDAVDDGNYVKASSLREKISKLLESSEDQGAGSQTSFSEVLFRALVILIILAAILGIMYFFFFREKEEGPDGGVGDFQSKNTDKFDGSSETERKERGRETVEFEGSKDDRKDF